MASSLLWLFLGDFLTARVLISGDKEKKQQIVSAGKGTVVYAGNGIAGFERLIIVKHSESLLSAYSFNGRITTREQRNVTVNDILGEILPISTKQEVFHFELRRNGQPVNPEQVLPKKVS